MAALCFGCRSDTRLAWELGTLTDRHQFPANYDVNNKEQVELMVWKRAMMLCEVLLTSFSLYEASYGHGVPKLLCSLAGDEFMEDAWES